MAVAASFKQPLKAVCIGECMVELSPAGKDLFRQAFAGDTYNTATYLARQFSPQIDVSYLTALGTSGQSFAMLEQFRREGINIDHIQQIAGKNPGLYMIENDASGERFFSYWRGQSAAKEMFAGRTVEALCKQLSSFDAIYLSGISLAILDTAQRSTLLAALKRLATDERHLIAFDPNYRPALWASSADALAIAKDMAAIASLCLVTLDDDSAMMEQASNAESTAKRWQDWGAQEVIIKHGAADCLILQDQNSWQVAPDTVLSPVDTTGAGDSFAAGYVGARLTGKGPEEAAKLAHRLAGQVIMHPGGVIDRSAWRAVD